MIMEPEKTYRLKEFAQKVGVYPGTVRNWQRRGVLRDCRNTVNNYRVFSESDVDFVLGLLTGKVKSEIIK